MLLSKLLVKLRLRFNFESNIGFEIISILYFLFSSSLLLCLLLFLQNAVIFGDIFSKVLLNI